MNNCKTAVNTPFIGEGYFLCRYYVNNEIDYVLIDNTQKKADTYLYPPSH